MLKWCENYFSRPSDPNCLRDLKILRERITAENEREQFKLLDQFYKITKNWKGKLPNLRDIFQSEEIDWLLSDSIYYCRKVDYISNISDVIIKFVARTGYKDEAAGGEQRSLRTTPVHYAASCRYFPNESMRDLFQIYNRFEVNYTNERGVTHFHVACKYDCGEAVEKFLENGQDPNILWPNTNDPLLHFAMEWGHQDIFRLLLKYGADPNQIDELKRTLLHKFANTFRSDERLMFLEIFYEICAKNHHKVQFDAQDFWGHTPLHTAMFSGGKKEVELLLRNGANPNLLDNEGHTPLHRACECTRWLDTSQNLEDHFVETFFKICDEVDRVVQVDVRNKLGETPLQIALNGGNTQVAEILLKRGANPNWPDEDGLTYLHNFCRSRPFVPVAALLQMFFKINDKYHKTVQVDARDKKGRTPLQLAVANLLPDVIDLLLDRGADLSRFVFPSESDFDESFDFVDLRSKMKLAFDALKIVENLQKRGYELYRSDAITIMTVFSDKLGLIEYSKDFIQSLSHNEYFVNRSKDIKIRTNLSLYDLIQLRPEDAVKLFTHVDYLHFQQPRDYWPLPCEGKHGNAYTLHMCEILTRGFFRSWALEPFMELTHNRLPIICCEMIIDNLINEDIYNICLAAENRCKRKQPEDATPYPKAKKARGIPLPLFY